MKVSPEINKGQNDFLHFQPLSDPISTEKNTESSYPQNPEIQAYTQTMCRLIWHSFTISHRKYPQVHSLKSPYTYLWESPY